MSNKKKKMPRGQIVIAGMNSLQSDLQRVQDYQFPLPPVRESEVSVFHGFTHATLQNPKY